MASTNRRVSVGMQFIRKRRITNLNNSATQHNVGKLWWIEFEQSFVVRNDQHAHLRTGELCQSFADHADSITVQTAVCFIKNRKSRLQHGELQNLHAFLFAARETVVEVTASKFRVHSQFVHSLADFLAKLTHPDQAFAFLAIRIADVGNSMTKEVSDFDPGDYHGILKRQKHPKSGTLIGFHLSDIDSVDLDRAVSHGVIRMPGQSISKRTLARSIRTHQGVNFALTNLHIDALQNRRLTHIDMQIGNLQHSTHRNHTSSNVHSTRSENDRSTDINNLEFSQLDSIT